MTKSDRRLVVIITTGSNSDLSTIGFTVANAARSTGKEVAVFLTSDGVYCGKEGYSDLASFKPFKNLDELITAFIDAGGTVWACTPCVQHRGIKQEDLKAGVIVTGAGPLLDWITNGAQTISF